MKYTIYWDDAGDERGGGTPFTIEANSLREAFYGACAYVLSYGGATAELFKPFHIEWLEDESGEKHRPQFFLATDERSGWPYGKSH